MQQVQVLSSSLSLSTPLLPGLQVGCPMRCTFCATGKGGFARSLAPHEILDQVMTVGEQFGKRVSNVGACAPVIVCMQGMMRA